jgi:hypothetical protein
VSNERNRGRIKRSNGFSDHASLLLTTGQQFFLASSSQASGHLIKK